ncbi:helix-turn-helix transcriptional regulator [Streptomyces sp. NPDC005423]|uniref:helix-turn-helix domain-containing protein n=1 Tax=Streptomyces sp. NPDC005423 TaxID=3155343 RepID=UPI0033B29581
MSIADICTERPTGRERQVLELLAAGHLDESIARQLNISIRTCRRIIASLMDRLEARSRFQAGVIAAARGWMDAPAPHPPREMISTVGRKGISFNR